MTKKPRKRALRKANFQFKFSFDILFLIIDQLAAECQIDELRACAQTCWMLLHPCRVHLFSTVTTERHPVQFADFLKKNPTIRTYVQQIEIFYRPEDYKPPIVGEDLINAFLLLKGVKTLKFNGLGQCDWKRLSPHVRQTFTQLFSSPLVSRLHVTRVDNIPSILLSSSTLKHLAVSRCSFKAGHDILGPPPRLLSLDVSGDYHLEKPTAIERLPILRRGSGHMLDFSSLRSLTVDILELIHFENILRLTPKVDYIHCGVFNKTPDTWAQKLTIIFPTLRSLKLSWETGYDGIPESALPRLINELKGLTHQPNHINELFLNLQIDWTNSDAVLALEWELLDQLLTDRSGFPQLDKVTVRLSTMHGTGWFLKEGIIAKFEKAKGTKFSRLLAANDYLDYKFEVGY